MTTESTTLRATVTSAELGDIEEIGGSLYATYDMQAEIAGGGGRLTVGLSGWYVCGWLAPGAHQDLNGSGLALWGSSQPGGWSACDSDGAESGRPRVDLIDDRDGAPVLRVRSGYGGPETLVGVADLGLAWPEDPADDDDAWEAARETMERLAEELAAAIEAAIPAAPAEPAAQDVWDALDAIGGVGAVRVGPYLADSPTLIVIRDGDDYTLYHPSERWESAAREAAGRLAVAEVESILASLRDPDDDDDDGADRADYDVY